MEELKRKADILHKDVEDLRTTVDGNTESTRRLAASQERLADRMNRSDRDRRGILAVVLILGVLVMAGGWVTYQTHRTAQAQVQLRAEVLCPLYGIFLGAYDPASRDKSPDPQAREKYEDAYQKIRRGWSVMECTDPIVPPRADR